MARVLCVLLALITAPAYADIFKWTDENGVTVMSNVPPAESGKSKNFKVVLKDSPPAAPSAAPARVATPTEQELRSRVESLERELRARQYAELAPVIPPLPPAGAYYPSSYPGYYPNYYYPAPSRSYVVYPATAYITSAVRIPARGRAIHAAGGHRSRR